MKNKPPIQCIQFKLYKVNQKTFVYSYATKINFY